MSQTIKNYGSAKIYQFTVPVVITLLHFKFLSSFVSFQEFKTSLVRFQGA